MNWSVRLLVCLVSVGATRYGDYSRVKMPHYNMDYESREAAHLSDDYKDHSLDAAPSLDYEYEKEPHDNTILHDHDYDTWQRPSKQKKSPKLLDDRMEVDKEADLIPKFKSNRRFRNHRTRIKNNFNREDRRRSNYDIPDEIEDVQIHDRNNYPKDQLPEDNRLDFGYRFSTEKINRRKPRDRTTKTDDTDDKENFRLKDSDTNDMEDQIDGRLRIATKSTISDRRKLKHYQEYDDYFDMKRINNIKNKLPSLLRQTKVESSATESPNTRPLQDITYYRRANVETEISQSTTESIETITKNNLKVTINNESETLNKTELSLAEKSRLSILRKAQKKESIRNVTWTTKPPVLMLVTSKMQTIVMVEPRPDIQMRGRDVFDDSSERIARAKKLMRHKLVAGARRIQDLTDNWDDMVCDYIDVSLLDNEYTTTTISSVAERELKAYLGHRQRRVSGSSPNLPLTFPPNAVRPGFHDEWENFIQNNNARRWSCPTLVFNCVANIIFAASTINFMPKLYTTSAPIDLNVASSQTELAWRPLWL